jgi:hypothetical protein
LACGSFATIVGGGNNNACGACSFIGGGGTNVTLGNYATVVGGFCNAAPFNAAVIVGGCSNCGGAANAVVVGGNNNRACANFAYIGSGCNNCLIGLASFIGGGSNNNISACGNYAAVVGGFCNTASAAYAGVFGCGITNSIACSFAANQLWACNLVGSTVALCVGTNGVIVRGVSDCRLKTNICNLPYGLCDVKKLNPVSFDWNEVEREYRGCNRQIGFIAQEVEPIIPEAVGYQADNGEYSLSPDKIIPVLTKALQELSIKVDAQEKRISILEDIIKSNNLI